MPGIMSEDSGASFGSRCVTRRESRYGLEVPPIRSNRKQSLGNGTEQEAVKEALVLAGQRSEFTRHGEDDMTVGHGQ